MITEYANRAPWLSRRGRAVFVLAAAWAWPFVSHGAPEEGVVEMNQPAAIEFPAEFFPLLPWGRGPAPDQAGDPVHGLPSVAECGFTLANFVRPEILPLCAQVGLKAIVQPASPVVGRDEWTRLSAAEIEERVRRMIEAVGDSPALLGYYLIDEPGASKFPGLGAAVSAVRRYAPGKLAYINLFPGYATIGAPDQSQLETGSFSEYLERYVREVRPQFISYDNYIVQYSQDLRDAKRAAAYYRDLLEVRRVALAHHLPFWNICSSNQIRPFTPIPSPANLAFQAYTTLAAGGRGLSWFTYDIGNYQYRPIDKDGRRTPTWRYLQMVNRQVRVLGPIMNRLVSTGVFFTAPGPVPDLPLLPGTIVEAVQASRTGPGKNAGAAEPEGTPAPAVMVGEFVDAEQTTYAMFVNLDLGTSARVVPVIRGAGALEELSPENGTWSPVDLANGLWLVAGQGVLLRHR